MIARARRWGNGVALRVRKRDLEAAGVSEGDLVRVEIRRVAKKGSLKLEDLPTFRDADPRASVHHDKYLYG
ncbi:MAG TPA: hypothetical protein VIB49_08665 [Thermoplasmata archaeon]|jgi:antitoxin component of MazEF toxin-antitoxin module